MINWTAFEGLPGDPRRNFEMLCRALIRLHYGLHGDFAALANQPGVEFHLKLNSDCSLGKSGRWLGWQCKWYDLPPARALGATRRGQIEQSLSVSLRVLPELTDWILWTRRPLTASDQTWFYKLTKRVKLQLWTARDAEQLLTGNASLLRESYFGKLIVTPALLSNQHEQSVARVRKRWLPEAHQVVEVERTLRRILGEVSAWRELKILHDNLLAAAAVIRAEPLTQRGTMRRYNRSLVGAIRQIAKFLENAYASLETGDLDLLNYQLATRPVKLDRDTWGAPGRFRAARLPCALDATNALSDLRRGLILLGEIAELITSRLVAVVADAGGGKTQLCAQMTSSNQERPAGVFLHGRDLHSGRTIDDLVGNFILNGQPAPSAEALIIALDSAAKRARCRLPLMIDGLNESEDPREWKSLLAALEVLLRRFPNVLVVCTLRTGARRPMRRLGTAYDDTIEDRESFANQALPESVMRIEMKDFGSDTGPAITKYFEYFKIEPGEADVPLELLGHPLTLRIFCEVTNPSRATPVGVEAMPFSLAGLFDRFLIGVVDRVCELAPRAHRYYEHDVRRALAIIGDKLWELNDREIAEPVLREALGDAQRPWDRSIVQLLEQEGVILRVPGDIPGEQSIIAVFDALGGHLAADALLAKHGRVGFVPWLEAPTTQQALLGHTVNTHPLAVDIFRALVGLLPRRLRDQQLWQVIGESYRNAALRQAAALEAAFLDEATISALADYILQGGSAAARLLARLRTASSAERHPLNAEFTDAVLRKMSLPDRDHLWTEWIRENCDQVYEDVGRWRARWQISPRRTPTDRLRAIWVSWSLTTTIRKLRNGATEALYWYGREDPDSLFTITRAAAEIDDLYVFERTLAASYGVAMVIYADVPRNDARRNILKSLARWLFDAMFETDAPYRTTHEMTRDYASRIVELVAHIDRKTFDRDQLARVRGPYSDGGRVPWPELEPGSERMYGLESPFRMDFQNYTLGQLIPDRNNYDFENARYRDVREKVLWRIKALGWSKDRFEKIDHAIESTGMYPTQVVEKRGRIDRYGKKYSWIAYFEIRGWLRDQGRLPNDYEQEPYTYRDIDPSFPRSRIEQRVLLRDVLGRPDISTSHWVKNSRALDLSPELRLPSIMGEHGPWVALNGYVACQDEVRGRRIFAFARAYLISKEDANKCSTLIKGQAEWERAFPDEIASYHTFAGEVPWCSTSPKSERVNLRFTVRETPVKVKRKRAVIYVDGKPLGALSDRILDRLAAEPAKASNPSSGSEKSKELQISVREVTEEFMEIRREEYKIKAIVPVFGYSWTHEQSDGVPIHGTVLATRLSRLGGLINIPQTLDFQTRGGVRATYGLEYQRDDFVNTERWCFIRESILDSLLKRLGLTVVWVVHGERELSVNLRKHGVPDASIADPPYARFHKFHRR